MTMQEWLQRRQAKVNERDRLRKWVAAWLAENPDADARVVLEDIVRVWQGKRPEYSMEEWLQIYALEDLSKLSMNDLLAAYRDDVPHGPYDHEYGPVTSSIRLASLSA